MFSPMSLIGDPIDEDVSVGSRGQPRWCHQAQLQPLRVGPVLESVEAGSGGVPYFVLEGHYP